MHLKIVFVHKYLLLFRFDIRSRVEELYVVFQLSSGKKLEFLHLGLESSLNIFFAEIFLVMQNVSRQVAWLATLPESLNDLICLQFKHLRKVLIKVAIQEIQRWFNHRILWGHNQLNLQEQHLPCS